MLKVATIQPPQAIVMLKDMVQRQVLVMPHMPRELQRLHPDLAHMQRELELPHLATTPTVKVLRQLQIVPDNT